ncbi:MAG: potassium-transporting ATPase subunit KdpA, partial [Candidatus Acidiferrum sp.]
MSANGWFQIGLFVAAIFLVTKPLGVFMVRVFEHGQTWFDPILRPVEKLIYRLCGVE